MGSELEVDESLVKNNRPLLEVEVETKYPIFPGRVQFRLLPAENKRDGYMELRCSAEENLSSVHMRRIDNAIQVAPAIVSAEAQTTCPSTTLTKQKNCEYFFQARTLEMQLHNTCTKLDLLILYLLNANLKLLDTLMNTWKTYLIYFE